jgi:hypothetical protein
MLLLEVLHLTIRTITGEAPICALAILCVALRARDFARLFIRTTMLLHAFGAVVIGTACFCALIAPTRLVSDPHAFGSMPALQAALGIAIAAAQFVTVILGGRALIDWIRPKDHGDDPPPPPRRRRRPFPLRPATVPSAVRRAPFAPYALPSERAL